MEGTLEMMSSGSLRVMKFEIGRSKGTCPRHIVSGKWATNIWSFAPAGKALLYPTCLSSNYLISHLMTLMLSNTRTPGAGCKHLSLSCQA